MYLAERVAAPFDVAQCLLALKTLAQKVISPKRDSFAGLSKMPSPSFPEIELPG